MLNNVVLMGRLTKDPELRQTPQGVSVANFTLAVERNYSKGEEKQTDFINIIAWRNTADFVSKYFTKGQLVAIRGRLQTRTWQDQSGQKRYATDVVADEVFFAESRGKTEQTDENPIMQGFSVSDENLPF